MICPICKLRPLRRKTCGDPVCQYRHHLLVCRGYWDKFHRKTKRISKKRYNLGI
jgi:hypothetical protein